MSDADTLNFFFLHDINVTTKSLFNTRSDSFIMFENM